MAGDPTGASPDAGPVLQLARFALGDAFYAIDIMKVREVVNPLPITAVPGAPAFLEGLVELRGEFLPVIDLRRRLGLPAGPDYKILIAKARGHSVGMLVDQVYEVFRVAQAELQDIGELARSSSFAGVLRRDEGAVIVVDPDGVLSEVEAGELRGLGAPALG